MSKFDGPVDIDELALFWRAIQDHPSPGSKTERSLDERTQSSHHSILAMELMYLESDVPAKLRYLAARALLWHDVLEDSTRGLPDGMPEEVVELVRYMTFPGGSKQERAEIWAKPKIVWWLKAYDKCANLGDGGNRGGWMEPRGPEYRRAYIRFAHDLLNAVEANKAEIFPERPDCQLMIAGMIRGCFPLS